MELIWNFINRSIEGDKRRQRLGELTSPPPTPHSCSGQEARGILHQRSSFFLGAWSLSPTQGSWIQSNRDRKEPAYYPSVGISGDSVHLKDSDHTIPGKKGSHCYNARWRLISSVTAGGDHGKFKPMESSAQYTQQWLWGTLYFLKGLWAESQWELRLCGLRKRIGFTHL